MGIRSRVELQQKLACVYEKEELVVVVEGVYYQKAVA